jgi:hypothetical protein
MDRKQINERIDDILSRRDKRHLSRGERVSKMLESARGARPSDDYVDTVDEPEDDNGFAPVAGNMEEEPDLSYENLERVAQEKGLKPIERDGGFDSIDMDVLKKGMEVEKEHTDDPLVAAVIAAHHILEPGGERYYDELASMEQKLRGEDNGELDGDAGLHGEQPIGGDMDPEEEPEPEEPEDELDEKCGKPGEKAKKAAGKSYSKTKEPDAFYGTATNIQKAMDKKK